MAKQNLICMNSAGYDIRHLHYQPYAYCFLVSQTQKVLKIVEIRRSRNGLIPICKNKFGTRKSHCCMNHVLDMNFVNL